MKCACAAGPWGEGEDWTDHFRRVIGARLGTTNGNGYHCRHIYDSDVTLGICLQVSLVSLTMLCCVCSELCHDIRFNLMAVVRDKRVIFQHKLDTLRKNHRTILDTLQKVNTRSARPHDKHIHRILGYDCIM